MQWLAIESAGDAASQLRAFQKHWSLKEVSMSARLHVLVLGTDNKAIQ